MVRIIRSKNKRPDIEFSIETPAINIEEYGYPPQYIKGNRILKINNVEVTPLEFALRSFEYNFEMGKSFLISEYDRFENEKHILKKEINRLDNRIAELENPDNDPIEWDFYDEWG